MSHVSLAEHKDFLQIPASDTTRDLLITRLAEEVEDFFQSYTGRQLSGKTETIYLNGNGTDSLTLPTKPVSSVTSVEILDNVDGTILTYGSADLRLDPPSGRVKLMPTPSMLNYSYPILSLTPIGFMNVRVTYVAGYVNVPPAMKLMFKRLLAFFMDPTSVGMSSRKRFGNIEFDARTKSVLPADLRFQLDGYRKILL